MINTAVLTGRLTKDINLKYTQSGTAVGNFTLAVDRNFKDKSGNKLTDFINCVAWGKTGENMANFFHKGSLVGIQGEIQTRNYDNKQGQKVYVTEINVQSFTFLESKNQQNNYQGNNEPSVQSNNDKGGDDDIDIPDSQLPF